MIDDKPLIDAIQRAEAAQVELLAAVNAQGECQASVVKLLGSGDTSEMGISALLAEEGRARLFISKIEKLGAGVKAATPDLKNSLGGLAEAARDEVKQMRAQVGARAEAFLLELPCFPDQVAPLVKQIIAVSLEVRTCERFAERVRAAANTDDTKRLLAAARDVLTQRPTAVQTSRPSK
jgi:hypothetical protein